MLANCSREIEHSSFLLTLSTIISSCLENSHLTCVNVRRTNVLRHKPVERRLITYLCHLLFQQTDDSLLSYNGEIVLALKYVPPSAVVSKKKKKKKKGEEEKGELHVNIIEATNLIAKDSNGFSDPFCKRYVFFGQSACVFACRLVCPFCLSVLSVCLSFLSV